MTREKEAARNPVEEMLSRIRYDHGCWQWTGNGDEKGYGVFTFKRRTRPAHRAVFEALIGPVSPGLHIDHLCRNRRCVNPLHLEPVTMKENILRGSGPCAANALKTHCPQGHPYSPRLQKFDKNGKTLGRRCEECYRASNKRKRDAYAARQRELRRRGNEGSAC